MRTDFHDLVKDASLALAILALAAVIMQMDLSWMFHIENPTVVSMEQTGAP